MIDNKLIAVLGPTASGKTKVAVNLAFELNSEIISGDSRQVYRGMDIGTGKDIDEYTIGNKTIPYHLIDIVDAGYKYNIYKFQNDFFKVYKEVQERCQYPILCGGSGLYMESVTRAYNLVSVPPNEDLKKDLKSKSLEELITILSDLRPLHNKSDTETKRRVIRAIEIADYQNKNKDKVVDFPQLRTLFIGVDIERELRRTKISKRLEERLQNGMVEEVKQLLELLSPEDLIYYGLEYKYLTLYLTGNLGYKEMKNQLEIAIHQFAKRQMTWYRGMERRGVKIHWIKSTLLSVEKNEEILNLASNPNNWYQT